jgi:glutamate-1-semialdehyde-2,1-aminomutase
MKIVAVVQARMGSTRLPGKVLKPLAGRPMLWHVLTRALAAKSVDEVVLATTDAPEDRALEPTARALGVRVVYGHPTDVLDRFRLAAQASGADAIVRVTADCPFLDPEIVDACVELFKKSGAAYASNAIKRTFPDGLDVEVFSSAALETAWKEAALPSEREHVTPFIWKNPARFPAAELTRETDLSALRWCVDNPEDLLLAQAVCEELGRGGRLFGCRELLQFIQGRPDLAALNAGIDCNEGYAKSLKEDQAAAKRSPAMRAAQKTNLAESLKLMKKAESLIPGISQTFSKAPNQFVRGVTPVYIERAEGCRMWDVDGNEYVDFPLALGPIILGHKDPDVDAAVRAQLDKGTIFSLPHRLEVEVAELLTKTVPCAEMVRFGKNGSDATAGAVRIARAFTGREIVACCGYHGWQDWYVGTTTRNEGVPKAVRELTKTFEYNDAASLEKLFAQNPGKIACVILEAVGVVEPQPGFLKAVAEIARKNGAILIFDEVVTGFRLALGGAQEHFGVTPDLACFAKAMANGYPVSAVAGRKDLMRKFEDVFFSFTFGGEALSLAAAKATIAKLKSHKVIPHLWRQGQKIKDAFNADSRRLGIAQVDCIGLAPHTVVRFRDAAGADSLAMRSLFQQELIKRGILFLTGYNICFAHDDETIAAAIRANREALEILAAAVKAGDVEKRLEGPSVEAVFRKA